MGGRGSEDCIGSAEGGGDTRGAMTTPDPDPATDGAAGAGVADPDPDPDPLTLLLPGGVPLPLVLLTPGGPEGSGAEEDDIRLRT